MQELEQPSLDWRNDSYGAPSGGVAVSPAVLDDIARSSNVQETLPEIVEDVLVRRVRQIAPRVALALAPDRASLAMGVRSVEVDIGPSTRIPWPDFIRGAANSARAVALVRTRAGVGTGFLIGSSTLITNNHVFTGTQEILASAADADGATAVFNYEQDSNGKFEQEDVYALRPTSLFHASTTLDYAICGVERTPGQTWGEITLPEASDFAPGDDVYIIQHPRGAPKQVAASGNQITFVDDPIIQYTTDTLRGSSGSPVFDFRWRLIAIHHANKEVADDSGNPYFRNEGILISAISRDLAKAGIDVQGG